MGICVDYQGNKFQRCVERCGTGWAGYLYPCTYPYRFPIIAFDIKQSR